MKLLASTLLALSVVSATAELSDCIINCQEESTEESGCGDNYNTTLCMCDTEDFANNVKACLYGGGCSSDVPVFFNARSEFCGGDEEDVGAADKDNGATIEDTDGYLGQCILDCQDSAATEASCSSNYNATSCYCDNDDFATSVKECLYSDCSEYVTVFFDYRSDKCGTDNSTTTTTDEETIMSESAESTASSSDDEDSGAIHVEGLVGSLLLTMVVAAVVV